MYTFLKFSPNGCILSMALLKSYSRKNEETEPNQKQHPVLNVTGDGSKVQCRKEKYCIGTWNVRSINQSKLDVIKQEMED